MDPNYDEIIQNFCAFTMNPNTDIAIEYLTQSNWNLNLAYGLYMAQNGVHEEFKQEEVNRAEPQPMGDNQGFGLMTIPSFLFNMMKNVYSSAYEYLFPPQLDTLQGLIRNLPVQPPRMTALPLAGAIQYSMDRGKRTLIYLHDRSFGQEFIQNILCQAQNVAIINELYVLYAHFADSEQGIEVINSLAPGHPLVFAVLDSMQTIEILPTLPTQETFQQFLLRCSGSEQIQSRQVRNLQDRLIREQQERELKELEQQQLLKLEQEARHMEEVRLKALKLEEEKKQKQKEQIKKLEALGEEPEAGHDVSLISFKLPSGVKVDRRFRNSAEIELLYTFVETKGVERFELVFGYPSKVLTNGTVLSQGMNPRALVHVRLAESN
jgi:hypothetical protein